MKSLFLVSILLAVSNYYAQDTTVTQVQFNKHIEIGDTLFAQNSAWRK